MPLILAILLIVLLVGGLPTFGYHRYGPWPSSVAGIVLAILLVLILLGRV